MPNTYTELLRTTIGTNTTVVTLSSIPQGYTDLRLVIVPASSSGTNGIRMRINSDSTSAYSATYLTGNGTSAVSARETSVANMTLGWFTGISTTLGTTMWELDFLNYSNTTTNKTVLFKTRIASQAAESSVGLWRNTAAITSLSFNISQFGSSTGDFIPGSTFSLYGIANADQGAAKATGGIITEDSQYWYHTFGATGAFIPKQSLTCDYLVVAGGGGGGGQQGGGGGAGGLRAFASASFTATSYAVTIGSGGPGGFGNSSRGTNGNNSTFNSNSVTGGGGGATNSIAAGSGGSGGGGGINSSANGSGNAGSYSPVEGFAGGATSSGDGGAGGGGAGAVGVAKNGSGNGRDGGTGVSIYNSIDFSTWLTAAGISSSGKLAGGGGGGTSAPYIVGIGGAGGGGTGGNVEQQQPLAYQHGQANTGGGAGGGSQFNANAYGGNGGSGVVVIRYAK
jgi:hypothetical protein